MVLDLRHPRHSNNQPEPTLWSLSSSPFEYTPQLIPLAASPVSFLSWPWLSASTDPRLSDWLPSRYWWCLTGRCLRSSSCGRDFIVFAQQELSLISENQWTSTAELTAIGPLIFSLFMWHLSSSTSYTEDYQLIRSWERETNYKPWHNALIGS